MILRVGLTGGIASGKSTVARTLAGLGCMVVDADAVVARLYRPGEAGYEAIVRAYGRDILRADGEIDRPKLAATAFVDNESAKRPADDTRGAPQTSGLRHREQRRHPHAGDGDGARLRKAAHRSAGEKKE